MIFYEGCKVFYYSLQQNVKDLLITLLSIYVRWFAKRFLHPDIVAPFEYIFIWDEDLGVEHFNAEKYGSHFLSCI